MLVTAGCQHEHRMKVLIAHARYAQRGGEEAVVDAQARVLSDRGHAVVRFEPDNAAIGGGVVSQLRSATNSLWSIGARRDIARVIAEERPDVLHVHNNFHALSPSIYGAARKAGVPVVQHIHNARLVCINAFLERDGRECTDCVGTRTRLPGLVHRCYRDSLAASTAATVVQFSHRSARTWARAVDLFLPVSQSLADVVAADGVVPVAKVQVCPNGLAADPGERPGNADQGYAVYAGRLSPEKGVDVLLNAAEQVPELPLVIAGDGPSAEALRSRASGMAHVSFRGRLERHELDELLRGARVLVVPSVGREPFGMGIVEAAALGVPAIGSAVGGIPEIIDDGATGKLVPAGQVTALASQLRDAHKMPGAFATMGRAARARFESTYSSDAFANRLLAAYARLLP